MVNSERQLIALFTTGGISILLYGLCFGLGCYNAWTILYRQSYWRSPFISLQYIFGQLICLFKIVSLAFWI
jgi:hypothetical protein